VTAPAAPPAEDGETPRSAVRSTVEWILIIGCALLVAVVIKATLLQAFYIPSESMTPTLKVGERVLVNKVSYKVHDVHRGDVVVFKRPVKEADPRIKDLIKRVIGLPGDTIEARDNQIYINDKALNEPYLPKGTPSLNLPRTTVPDGDVFVMGDNRTNSSDSRVFGPISQKLIVGRAFVRVWPPGSIGLL
jgi:signal peptidase I